MTDPTMNTDFYRYFYMSQIQNADLDPKELQRRYEREKFASDIIREERRQRIHQLARSMSKWWLRIARRGNKLVDVRPRDSHQDNPQMNAA